MCSEFQNGEINIDVVNVVSDIEVSQRNEVDEHIDGVFKDSEEQLSPDGNRSEVSDANLQVYSYYRVV